MSEMKKYALMLTEEMREKVQQSAKNRGLTMNAVIVVALENYFHQQDAVDSMNAIQRQITLEEAKRRLLEEQKPD